MERKNSWQIAEYSGHRTSHRFQHLLGRADWQPDQVRDDVRGYVFEHLGRRRPAVHRHLIRQDGQLPDRGVLRLRFHSRAGATNLEACLDGAPITPEFVIGAYHRLTQIEKSFRISKHDFQAGPIHRRTRDSIEMHLTIVFADLGLGSE